MYKYIHPKIFIPNILILDFTRETGLESSKPESGPLISSLRAAVSILKSALVLPSTTNESTDSTACFKSCKLIRFGSAVKASEKTRSVDFDNLNCRVRIPESEDTYRAYMGSFNEASCQGFLPKRRLIRSTPHPQVSFAAVEYNRFDFLMLRHSGDMYRTLPQP